MKIAIVAPAGCVMPDAVHRAVNALQQFGVECQLGKHVFAQHRYFAGTTQQRLQDLQAACLNDEIDAIWCARGGVGAGQLVPYLGDWLLRKPIIGYSDITVLHNWVSMRGGCGLHAPVVQELYDKNRPEHAVIALDGQETLALLSQRIATNTHDAFPRVYDYPVTLMHPSPSQQPIQAKILGGNLAVLASIQGTAAALALTEPTILLLEDVGEPYYRLERLWVQILQSIDIRYLKAVVLGDFYNCPQKNVPDSLERIFAEHVEAHHIPLYRGDWFGHGERNRPFWLGSYGTIEHDHLQIKI